MKKTLIAGMVVLAIVGFSLAVFFPFLSSIAEKDYPTEGDEPDVPGFLKGKVDKEDFLRRRGEYIGLKRGFDKDNLVDPKLRQTAIAEMERQQAALAEMPESVKKNSLTAAWTPIGPAPIPNGQTGTISTPVSGRTVAIAVHPTNPNIVYVGTAQGGLYRSTDGGTNWTPLLDNALSLAIGAVAIAPSQPDTIYVGTGEGNGGFYGVGIYRIDNASSGSPIISGPLNRNSSNSDIFSGNGIGKIVVHPTNPAIIFAGTNSGGGGSNRAPGVGLPNTGVYRSTNATSANPIFTQIGPLPAPFDDFDVHDIAIDPLNPNLLLANLVVGDGGVYVSTNALAANPTFTNTQTFTGTGSGDIKTEFAIQHTPGNANPIIYAATGNGGGRVLRSTDGGFNWTQQIDNNFCGGQCFYDIAVAVDPNDPAKIYLGGDPTMIFGFSTNSGVSFTTVGAGMNHSSGLHPDSHAITVAPSLPSTIYFGNDGGIYKSINSGATWTSLNNSQFSATQFISIAVHPTDPNFTIGGTQDNGTNFYRPNGTWFRNDFGDGGYALIDQNATDTTNVRMYHTYFNGGNLQGYGTVSSTANAMDNGWTFRGCGSPGTTGNGITCNGSVLFYAPLEQGPGNPNTVYYGTDRLYRSTDAGLNHTVVSQNPITSGAAISAIGISPQNDNVRIIGQNNGGIFGTVTGSATLTNLDPSGAVPNSFIARAVIDPNNSNTAYVTLSVFGAANVWRTTNLNSGSPTWTAITGSGGSALPRIPVSAFLVDPITPNTLYAGTDIGVYSSSDDGASWQPFGTSLPRVAVFDMAITAGPNRKLRIATHGRGMYEMSLGAAGASTISISDVSLSEGNSGTTAFTFNISLSATSTQSISVNVSTSDGTATVAGNDYTAGAGVLTFNPGESTRTATFLVNGDTQVEPNETFFVNLSNPVNATISDNQGIGNILNDDSVVCSYAINPTTQNFPVTGGNNTIQVTSPNGCAWSSVSNSIINPVDITANNNLFSLPQVSDLLNSPQTLFTNSAPITINDQGAGSPYPSNITVSGLTGTVSDVNVRLNGLSHTFPDDIALLLVSPSGRQIVLQSNVGGGTDVTNLTYTLDDQAGAVIADTGPMPANNGSAKPSSVGGVNFTPPAPPAPWNQPAPAGSATLNGIFNGDAPNGVWRLFVYDSFAQDFGTISGGWSIDVTTQGGTTNWITITSGQSGNGNGTVGYTVASNATGLPRSGTMTIAGQTVTINQSNTAMQLRRKFDFDGDGRTDLSVFRPSNGIWYLQNSTAGFSALQFGAAADKLAPADFDGDLRTDIAVFRPSNGFWYLQQSNLGATSRQFGAGEDIPQPADFDGDGQAELIVYRPSNGIWYILNLANNDFSAFQFGAPEDKPVIGDYDGDGRADIAVYRPSNGIWYIRSTMSGVITGTQFGAPNDRPVAADYDGDGRTDIAVFRLSNGIWYIQGSQAGFTATQFGASTDEPAPGDYDGDGSADIAVYRPSEGNWYLRRSTQGLTAMQFGAAEDRPIPNAFVPR